MKKTEFNRVPKLLARGYDFLSQIRQTSYVADGEKWSWSAYLPGPLTYDEAYTICMIAMCQCSNPKLNTVCFHTDSDDMLWGVLERRHKVKLTKLFDNYTAQESDDEFYDDYFDEDMDFNYGYEDEDDDFDEDVEGDDDTDEDAEDDDDIDDDAEFDSDEEDDSENDEDDSDEDEPDTDDYFAEIDKKYEEERKDVAKMLEEFSKQCDEVNRIMERLKNEEYP